MHINKIATSIDSNIKLLESNSNIKSCQSTINNLLLDISNLLVQTDTDKFSSIIVVKVLKPLNNLISSLDANIPSGRSRLKERKAILEKRVAVKDLKNTLLEDYSEVLKNTSIYKKFLNEKSSPKDYILEPDLINGLPIELVSPSSYKQVLDQATKSILEYFNKRMGEGDMESYKNELFLFVNDLNNRVKELHDLVTHYQDLISKLEKDKTKYTSEVVVNEGETFNLYEIYNDKHFELDRNLEFNYSHLSTLESLREKLINAHLFLKDYMENHEIPLTVFGDRNYDKLEELYKEMKTFLHPSVSKSQLFRHFTYNNEPDSKLNLIEGTLSDFGELMNTMRDYFTSSVSSPSSYAKWWSKRFQFNGVDKDDKAIRKMWSLSNDRGTSKGHTLAQIRQILSKSPQ